MKVKIIKKLLEIFFLCQKMILRDTFFCCALGYLTNVIFYYSNIAGFIVGIFVCFNFMYMGTKRIKDKCTIGLTINVIIYCIVIDIILYHYKPWMEVSHILPYALGLLIGLLQSKLKVEDYDGVH